MQSADRPGTADLASVMSGQQAHRRSSALETTALLACIMSLPALSTDIMLPGLFDMGREFRVANSNDLQLVVTLVFFGLTPGQLVAGPLADAIGRRPTMLIGALIFLAGSAVATLAHSLHWLLIGRAIQGLGLGAPRTLVLAIIRDRYEGAEMARLLSGIMAVFACIPMVAPLLGQGLLLLAGWRLIFGFVFVFGLLVSAWFYFRQAETLPRSRRTPMQARIFTRAIIEVCGNPLVLLYALATGFIFAGFVTYMSVAAEVFQAIYHTGNAFGPIFALIGLAMTAASPINGHLVGRIGLERISYFTVAMAIAPSALLAGWIWLTGQDPGLLAMIGYLMLIMFAEGALYPNLNTLAMTPLTRSAGIGATLVSTVSMLVSVPLGMYVARFLTSSVLPLVLAFGGFACAALAMMVLAGRVAAQRNANVS